MNYTINQLRIFKMITETGSVTKASEALHLTQPAVSIQLKKFQDQFPIPLVEVTGRKLRVTEFGQEIAVAAGRILEEIEEVKNKTLTYKGLLAGKLKLSVVSTGKYVMPFFLTEFLENHQGIELELDVTNKERVVQSLRENETDFALVSVMPDDMELNSLTLIKNQLYLVGNSSEKFEERVYDKRIFNKLPLIYRESGSGTRFTMEQYFKKNGIELRKKLELTTNEAVKQAVLAGLGYSVLPLIGIKNEIQNGDLQIIQVKGFPIETKWNLIWLKKKQLSPVSAAFVEHLKNNKETIIKDNFSWYETSRK